MKAKKKSALLVTGSSGEIGGNLLRRLTSERSSNVVLVGLDINPPHEHHTIPGVVYWQGDLADPRAFFELEKEYDFEKIFHLGAMLSTEGEKQPELTLKVNVGGSSHVLALAERQGRERGATTMVVFTSTIAVYGLPQRDGMDREALKTSIGAVREHEFLEPITMYGVNKLAVEHLGRYYARHYRLLSSEKDLPRVDFRALRLSGVLSADTLPTGGTSDYAPEMVHSAARGEVYECFARMETTIPFMVMPDAITAIVDLSRASRERLTQVAYNVAGFSASAGDIATLVERSFPGSRVVFKANERRVHILESWPAAVDDNPARRDWGWSPNYDLRSAFQTYLIPGVKKRYTDCTAMPKAACRA